MDISIVMLPGSGASSRLALREGSDAEDPRDSVQADIERRFREMPSDATRNMVKNGEAHYPEEDEALLSDEIAQVIEVIDLTVLDHTSTARAPRKPREKPAKRNQSIGPCQRLDSYDYEYQTLKPGGLVEMEAVTELRQASFLLVQSIINTTNGVVLRGLPFTRTRNLRGQLPRIRNELALILEIDQDDHRSDEKQAAIEIPVAKIKRTRSFLITNKNFPEHRFPHGIYKDTQEIEEKGVLVCRWKCRSVWSDAMKRCNGKPPIEFEVSRITPEKVLKERYRTPGSCLMNAWRGGKIRGGSYIPGQPNDLRTMVVAVEGLEDQDDKLHDEWIPRKPGQQYTFGDMFCGAGGASCGARASGFRITVSCDNAVGACNTYREEFSEADLHEQDMYDFIVSRRTSTEHVDVLHISPPCQYWSPAHTTPGAGDEANIAILFACHELVKALRPRIFTVEQTYGILHPRFEYYFNGLIHGFTRYGYSVRWRVANLLQWGAASQRQRLIIFGSCPGEELPPFPPATHSKDPNSDLGTRPYKTVRQILNKIPRDARLYDPLHNPRNLKELVGKLPWDPDVPLSRTITCGGGVGNYHYSGKRAFTLREYALLQGFPLNYNFQRPKQMRQIGNAFPPLVVQTLYKHLRRWLEQQDRVYADGELSDSESDNVDDIRGQEEESADDSEVEYLGKLMINRNDSIQYLGGRYLQQQGSEPLTISDSGSEDDSMDVDAVSEDVHSPDVCIDAVQAVGNDAFHPIRID
ncbi:S-adenosyl-L-methionine-dependent methyltransferase [Daldinia bambusicola]|nr:S-adenosyl-L-methionine-dependent methyltransferase [Daldinia bambusicola]